MDYKRTHNSLIGYTIHRTRISSKKLKTKDFRVGNIDFYVARNSLHLGKSKYLHFIFLCLPSSPAANSRNGILSKAGRETFHNPKSKPR